MPKKAEPKQTPKTPPITIRPKQNEAVCLGWTDETFVFDVVIPFCSHARRSGFEKEQYAALGINRCVFSNLFVDDCPLAIPIPPRDDTDRRMIHEQLLGYGASYPRAMCAESYYMAAKCRYRCDAEFVMHHLTTSSVEVAAFGHNRLRLSDTQRPRLVELGADADDFLFVENGEQKPYWLRGRDGKLPGREKWHSFRHQVFLYILRHKFCLGNENNNNQGTAVQQTLQSLVAMIQNEQRLPLPVEHRKLDGFWGDAGDGSGFNVLGKTLAQIILDVAARANHKADTTRANSKQQLLFRPFNEIVEYCFDPAEDN